MLQALCGDVGQQVLKLSRYRTLTTRRSITPPVRRTLEFYATYDQATGSVPAPLQSISSRFLSEDKKIEDTGLFDAPEEEIEFDGFESVTVIPPQKIDQLFKRTA